MKIKAIIFSLVFLFLCIELSAQNSQNPFFQKSPEASEVVEKVDDVKELSKFQKMITSVQREFNGRLSEMIVEYKYNRGGSLFFYIIIFAFLYGLIHALSPGHGKSIITGWILSSHKKLYKITYTSILGMIVHVFAAYFVVLLIWFVLKSRISTSSEVFIKYLSYFAFTFILLIAAKVFFTALFKLLNHYNAKTNNTLLKSYKLLDNIVSRFDHKEVQNQITENTSWHECTTVAFSMGLVPCPVATLLTVFMLTKSLYLLSFLLILFFAIGMALTLTLYSLLMWLIRKYSGRIPGNRFGFVFELIFSFVGVVFLVFSAIVVITPYL